MREGASIGRGAGRDAAVDCAARACARADAAGLERAPSESAGEPSGRADAVVCGICPHRCRLREGAVGRCRARAARGGRVVPLGYGKATSLALDPIEKKPLARFRPGSTVLSVGGFGCNLSCPFCQNASIAQAGPDDVPWREVSPAELVERASALRGRGCIGIAYTYNEPVVDFEFVRDTARLAREAGLANVLVSNGMICAEPLAELAPLIDAANIDLKCFSQDAYAALGGDYGTVRRTIAELAARPGCHLEVTTLVVPGLSDDAAAVGEAARWLASLDPGITYHLTRFFPRHRMANRRPTPLATLHEAARAARRHLDDVVLGNC